MKIFYSPSSQARPEGQRYQNPRLFLGVVEGATEVTIDGDYPEIERAYASAGVKVVRTDGSAAASNKKPKSKPKAAAATAGEGSVGPAED